MNQRHVYLSGEFVSESEAMVPIRDCGWLAGEIITTTLRTFSHQPFRIEEHVARICRSCKAVRIDVGMSPTELRDTILELVRKNVPLIDENDDYRIDVDVTPGVWDLENERLGGSGATVFMYCTPLAFSAWADGYVKGCRLATATSRWLPSECLDPKIKHRSRLLYRIAGREAKLIDPKASFPLMLTVDGNVAETTGSSFFIVSNGKLITAPTSFVLAGVTRQATMEAAETLGIEVFEKPFQLYDVYNAEETFVTSTPFSLLPATTINHIAIGDGSPGPITRMLMEEWNRLVGMDIAKQALDRLDK